MGTAASTGAVTNSFGDTQYTNDLCVSPTGCYRIITDPGTVSVEVLFYDLGYSASTKSLIRNDVCDTVDVCGLSIHQRHEKRSLLNHLTQLIITDLSVFDNPSSPKYKALCWMLNEDELLDDFKICDGTLLQRFLLVYAEYNFGSLQNLDSLKATHTCDWRGITCDSKRQFLIGLNFSGNKLRGTIPMELGLLYRLQTINLSNNSLTGTLDGSMFTALPFLEEFSIDNNLIQGKIPSELLTLNGMRKIKLSGNRLMGVVPSYIKYAESLEFFNVTGNLLQGSIPRSLIECHKLQVIDMSRNNFVSTIPDNIENLSELQTLSLNENSLTGNIPSTIFNLSKLEVLALQANAFTGSIPTEIGLLQNAKIVVLNHNALKGTIPAEFSVLQRLEHLHLHFNQLTGEAPKMTFKNRDTHTYITDCGDPSFALLDQLSCNDCTMCCNSLNACQIKNLWVITKLNVSITVALLIPLCIGLTLWIFVKGKCFCDLDCYPQLNDHRTIYDHESVYCFIFSSDWKPKILYLLTAMLQVALYIIYIRSSSFEVDDNDWIFSYRCPENNDRCNDEKTLNFYGFFLFFVVIGLNLGPDISMSTFQIYRGVLMKDKILCISGFMLFFLTTMGAMTSGFYNNALAEKNTDLITNAVILLFVSEIDEQVLTFITYMVPDWTNKKLSEVDDIVMMKVNGSRTEEVSGTTHNSMQNSNMLELE